MLLLYYLCLNQDAAMPQQADLQNFFSNLLQRGDKKKGFNTERDKVNILAWMIDYYVHTRTTNTPAECGHTGGPRKCTKGSSGNAAEQLMIPSMYRQNR